MVVLINKFTVHGSTEQFERLFATISDYMREQPGFLNHRLVHSTTGQATYVNIAEWENPHSLQQAVRRSEFREFETRLSGVATSDPVLYQTVLTSTACEPVR